jgi:hypothetical protein
MNRRRYGWIAGVAGAALAAWYWRGRRQNANRMASGDRGEVIFRNTPVPSSEGIL